MKTSPSHLLKLSAVAVLVLVGSQQMRAANSSWNVDNAGSWITPSNWNNGVPGTAAGTGSADVATFDFTLNAARDVTVDANRNIGGITFGNTSAFGYTLKTGVIQLSNGGVIQNLAGTGDHTDYVSSALVIQGDGGSASVNANASSASTILRIGAVTGVSTTGNTTTLNLGGTNTVVNNAGGVIGDGSAGGKVAVVKNDSGTWTLGAANTFTGGLVINGGLVTSANSGVGAGTITFNGGALASVNANARTWSNNIIVGGDFTLGQAATYTGALTLNGTVDLGAATRTITVANNTVAGDTISGVISGADGVGLTKTGTGMLVLSGANTYNGRTTVNAGTLRYGAANTISSSSNITVNANASGTTATLDLNGFSGTIGTLTLGGTGGTSTSVNQVTTGAGTLTLNGTVTVASTGNPTTSALISGNVNVGAGQRIFNVNNSSGVDVDLNVNAVLSGSGISKAGAGTMLLSQASTLTGNNQITDGTLRFGIDNALNSSGSFTVRGATSSTLDLNGFNGTVGSLTLGGLSGTSSSVHQVTTGVGTLTIGGNVNFNSTGNTTTAALISGNLNLGGATRTFDVQDSTGTAVDLNVSAAVSNGGITKSGAGTLALSGTNTYTDGTLVSAGTLLINGSTNVSSAVTVANTATLGGSGVIGGTVTVQSGGTLAPGSSIESLASGALTFDSGSTFGYQMDFSASLSVGADLQVVTGNLDLNGTVELTLENLNVGTFANNTKFTLINYNGAWNNGLFTYNSILLNNGDTFSFNGQDWKIDYNATSGGSNFSGEYLSSSNFVNITAVPEPAAWILAAFGLTAIVVFRRRKTVG